jgi:hypothetical protein
LKNLKVNHVVNALMRWTSAAIVTNMK